MDERYEEKEIDLKRLFYKTLKKWRTMVVAGAVGALVIGGTKCAMELVAISDPERVAERELEYAGKLAEYQQKGESIRLTIEDLEDSLERQLEYNDASVMMKIDPYQDWSGSLSMYVETDYQIMPDMSYQNVNIVNQILQVYNTYISSGELHQYVNEQLGLGMELRYLREILGGSVDFSTYMLNFSVRGVSQEDCQAILTAVEQGIKERQPQIISSIGEFKLESTNNATFSQVNYDLEQTQKNNLQAITNLQAETSVKELEYLEWRRDEAKLKRPVVSKGDAVKTGIKWAILAGIVLAAVVAVGAACGYLLAGTVQGAESLPNGVYLLGELPGKVKKRGFLPIDTWLANRFGVLLRENENDTRLAAAAELTGQLLKAKGETAEKCTVALVSDMAPEALGQLSEAWNKCAGGGYTVTPAGNMTTDAAAAKCAAGAAAIVFVAVQGKSHTKTLSQMTAQAKACGQTVLGAVVVNADARP